MRSKVTAVSHVCYQLHKNEQGGTEDAFCWLSIFKNQNKGLLFNRQDATMYSHQIPKFPQGSYQKQN